MEILGFFLSAFITICFARPLALLLGIPTLLIYIVAGILFGPSGIGFVKDVSSLNYFYELGIVLLMFTAGLELKVQPIQKENKSLNNLLVFNLMIPAIAGFVFGFLISIYFGIGSPVIIGLYLVTLFSSPAPEVVIQLFREFGRKIDYVRKRFFQQIVISSVFADLFSLLIFTLILAFHLSSKFYDLIKLFIFGSIFFLLVFKALPVLHERWLSRLKGMNSSEDETTTLLMLLVIVVAMGAVLQIPPVVCAFLAGISLANIHINRMVRNNINFIAAGIFVPIFFIIVGAKVNLSVFGKIENLTIALITICVLVVIRVVSFYIASRNENFSLRDSLGFSFCVVPQLTGALAIGIVLFNANLIPEVLFNSIIILSIVTTTAGTFFARHLLFPGIRRESKDVILVEDFYTEIKPFNIMTPICDIARRLKYTELSVYPVVDNEGVYKGVIHLDDVRDTMFKEEIACLVISADVLDSDYPSIEKDATIKEAMRVFSSPGIFALVVVESINNKKFYAGMLLLQDILPEIQYTRS